MEFISKPGDVYDYALRGVFSLVLKGSEQPEVQGWKGAAWETDLISWGSSHPPATRKPPGFLLTARHRALSAHSHRFAVEVKSGSLLFCLKVLPLKIFFLRKRQLSIMEIKGFCWIKGFVWRSVPISQFKIIFEENTQMYLLPLMGKLENKMFPTLTESNQ